MILLSAQPDITPITDLIATWIHIGQALVASVGALAFIFALACLINTAAQRLAALRRLVVVRQVLQRGVA
jgi:hypothetical protein